MPRLSVFFIRAALIYLLLAFTIGGWLLVNKGMMFSPWIWRWLPAHMEFALMGWMVQLAMGVAFWILPRFARRAARGPSWLLWLSFVLYNAGVLLFVGGSLLTPAWLLWAGRASELAGILAFVAGSWRRVKPIGAE